MRGVGAEPWATPAASVKCPKPARPAKTASENPNIAAAPTTTSAIPIHRSTRSYLMNLGVMRLSMM